MPASRRFIPSWVSCPHQLCSAAFPARTLLTSAIFFQVRNCDESSRENSERPGRRHARERRVATERAAGNQSGHQTPGGRKDPRAGRDGIHSDPADAGEAAQGIHRAVHQGQPAGAGRERNQGTRHHRVLSAGRSERSRDERCDYESHFRDWSEFHQAHGRGRERREGGSRREVRRRQGTQRSGARAPFESWLNFAELFPFCPDSSCSDFTMPLPETIAVRFTEEDAGYVTVRPVVRQVFRLAELVDMVLSVTGKNELRVKQIFRAGTVVYNGFRYSWEGFVSEADELAALLAPFPDDDPLRAFNADAVTAVTLEIGGGTQRSLIAITRQEASARRLFQKRSPWEILLGAARESAPRYEKYSHAQRGDVYRLHVSAEAA